MRRVFRRSRLGKDGIAAVEFALLAPVFILFLALLLDLGLAYNTKLKVVSATAAAAQFAFLNGQSMTASGAPAFLTNVSSVATAAADLTVAPTVTVTFNNASDGSNASNYYCVSGSSPTSVAWTSTGTTSSTCGGSVMSGKFVSIVVSATTSTLLYSSSTIGSIITEQDAAIVRVE